MSWLTFLIAILAFNGALGTFWLVGYLTEEYRRRLRLRKRPKGRMVPISSHPRYDDRRAS
jgi:hypothetical protein